jgi:hypothetical protein
MNKTGKATQISDFSYALPVDDCVYTISTAQANNLDTLLWQAERENWEYMPQSDGRIYHEGTGKAGRRRG